MIYKRKPKNFSPKFEVVSCFCEFNKQFLLLHRQDHKDRGNLWGVPAGKIDPGETVLQAVQREIFEETGLKENLENIEHFIKVYVRYPDYDFIYHIFHIKLDRTFDVKIDSREHKAFTWVTPTQALEMNLVPDQDLCIKLFYSDIVA